jgi:hypothetical protein
MSSFEVPDAQRGKKVRCPSCQMSLIAGGAASAPISPPPRNHPAKRLSVSPPEAGGRNRGGKPPTLTSAKTVRKTSAAAPTIKAKPKPQAAVQQGPTDWSFVSAETNAGGGDALPSRRRSGTKSPVLSILLIVVGVVFLGCAGLAGVGVFFWYRIENELGEQRRQEAQAALDADKAGHGPQADKKPVEQKPPKKKERQQPAPEKKQPKKEEPDNEEPDPTKTDLTRVPDDDPPKGKPADPQPDDAKPDPKTKPKPDTNIVQPVAKRLKLETANQPAEILFTSAKINQVAVYVGVDAQTSRLDLYDLATSKKATSLEMPAPKFSPQMRDLSPDSKWFAAEDSPQHIAVWSIADKKQVIEGWQPPAKKVAKPGNERFLVRFYLLTGNRLLTVNGVGEVNFWSLPGRKLLAAYHPPNMTFAQFPIQALRKQGVALSPDRKLLAVYNGVAGFSLIDTTTYKMRTFVEEAEDKQFYLNDSTGVAFSPDGSQLAVAFQQGKARGSPVKGTVLRWDLKTGKLLGRFADQSRLATSPFLTMSWWGTRYLWFWSVNGEGALASWNKGEIVVRNPGFDRRLGTQGVASPDGRHWFAVSEKPGAAVFLAAVDLPAQGFKATDGGVLAQPPVLSPGGIVKNP